MCTKRSLLPWVWSATVAAACVVFAFELWNGITLETNILALLPQEKETLTAKTIETFTNEVSKSIVVMVGSKDPAAARAGGALASRTLVSSSVFSSVQFERTAAQRNFLNFYFPRRYSFLAPDVQSALQTKEGVRALLRDSEAMLYSPLGALAAAHLGDDPLLLFPRLLRSLPAGGTTAALEDDVLMIHDGERHYSILTMKMAGSAFSIRDQAPVVRALAAAEQELHSVYPEATMLCSGLVRFAARSAVDMQREASLISFGSLLALALLLLLAFQSLRQLLLAMLAVGVGLVFAVSISILIFAKLHLIALAFGASLTGVCIDYSLYYLAEQRLARDPWDSRLALARILPTITLGALTTVLGYLSLALTRLPGLQQMAVFSAIGIIGAYLTVVAWFPALLRHRTLRVKAPPLFRTSARLVGLWSLGVGTRRVLGLAVAVLVVVGVLRLTPDDDVRLLQAVPADLIIEEREVARLLGNFEKARFLAVQGATEEQALERLAAVDDSLQEAKAAGALDGFMSPARFLPSCAAQHRNAELVGTALRQYRTEIESYLTRLGFAGHTYASLVRQVDSARGTCLRIQDWVVDPVSQDLRQLWLGNTGDGWTALVMLRGLHNEAQVRGTAEALAGVTYINKVEEISNVLKRYRERAMRFAAAGVLLIFLCLVVRYGVRRARRVIAPPLLAACIVLGVLGIADGHFNLFHIMSLTLLLGVGIDYAIFFAENGSRDAATMFAVLLCALGTLLSFGTLALCQTPLLRSFGISLVIGVASALILSPWPGGDSATSED